MKTPRFVFFGTPDIAVVSLIELSAKGLIPALIVTAPDKPRGRGRHVSPTPVRVWADEHAVPTVTPATLKDPELIETLRAIQADIFVVVAYGKILPKEILTMTPYGIINMHPSLLPKHRGPSPIESQILHEENPADVGVSIMLLDEAMDHGPVLAQKKSIPQVMSEWPMSAKKLYPILAHEGAVLLTETLLAYTNGLLTPTEQDDTQATYCSKLSKDDGLINITERGKDAYQKICAYAIHPRPYFFTEKHGKKTRVIIADAILSSDGTLVITRVIPEGRKEMAYDLFARE